MITYHKLDVKLKTTSLKPLNFIGSTIRGAFGVSLKKVACINPSFECDGCFAKDECIYYDFYEEKNKAHKYRFDFELGQSSYDFSLYLFEESIKKLPQVVSALHRMLRVEGLTKDRVKFEIAHIYCNQKSIYKDNTFELSGIEPKEFFTDEYSSSLKLSFKTPLRIKHHGKLLSKTPPLEVLLLSIQNRLNELRGYPKTKLSFTPKYKTKISDIVFLDQKRRSNRQKKSLQIGGVVGFIEYEQIDQKSFILLKLGEILGVGKQTVFGMGKIVVESVN